MADTPLAQRTSPASQTLRPRFSWLSDRWMAIAFISPTMAILLFVSIFPLIWSLYLSFTDWSVIRDAAVPPVSKWVGTANYLDLLTDDLAWKRFIVTRQVVSSAGLIELALGFGIAMLFYRRFPRRDRIMTLMLVPMKLSHVVVALFWGFMVQGECVVDDFVVNLMKQDR